MADDKVNEKKLDQQIQETKEQLKNKADDYKTTIANYMEEFDNDTKIAYEKAKNKVKEIGEDISDGEFADSVKKGFDDFKDKVLNFFHDFDKKHVDKDVSDIKDSIETTKQNVDDSEAGKAVSQKMDELKGHLDEVATGVSASDNK